jgi:CIC family chloride channel protein
MGRNMELTVRDLMSREVQTIPCSASLGDAERLLVSRRLSELFVVDGRGYLVGLLPDVTLLKLHLSDVEKPASLASVLSRRFLVIGADAPARIAAKYLREHIHHRLAVVEGRRLVGVITRKALLQHLVETGRRSEAA